ncbi:hypothetical protein [Caballeronia sp. LjRoot31]|uniref:hypothetical protein n=1 Tax=Caballeronia sp. LjRoot31 TaxID=3342324 RepID=UPI003ED05F7C
MADVLVIKRDIDRVGTACDMVEPDLTVFLCEQIEFVFHSSVSRTGSINDGSRG